MGISPEATPAGLQPLAFSDTEMGAVERVEFRDSHDGCDFGPVAGSGGRGLIDAAGSRRGTPLRRRQEVGHHHPSDDLLA
ncbi:MAG: hypothetical protein WCJ21_07325, partial [Planctomycetota bacterium]